MPPLRCQRYIRPQKNNDGDDMYDHDKIPLWKNMEICWQAIMTVVTMKMMIKVTMKMKMKIKMTMIIIKMIMKVTCQQRALSLQE